MNLHPGTESPFAPAPKLVTQPTFSILMSGVIRLQVPASPQAQACFDLTIAALKEHPDQLDFVCQDVSASSGRAMKTIEDYMRRSPGLSHDGKVGLSYSVIDGKLSYVFQLCVRTK